MKSHIAAFLLLGTAALAQEEPSTGWASNEVVVVTAQPGPAFWHIKKGDSEIYVLGIIGEMPKGQSWNTAHLTEVIDGAHAVLTAPRASSGIFGAGWFLLTHRGLLSMPDGKKLEDTLPDDLKARLIAARTSLNIPAKALEDDPPILVAFKLQDKFNETSTFDGKEPYATVAKIAQEKHVAMRPIADYSALDIIKEALRLPQEQQRVCLDESLEKLDSRRTHTAALAQAWSVGDVKAMKAHFTQSGLSKCFKAMAAIKALTDRAVKDYLRAIDTALAKPGKTVMLTDIGNLLRGEGVVAQLVAKGITVEGPGE